MASRYLFCSHVASFSGGAERCLYLLLKYARLDKSQVLVILPSGVVGGFKEKLDEIGIPSRVIRKRIDVTPVGEKLKHPLKLFALLLDRLFFAMRFARVLRGYRPDLVYLNTMRFSMEAMVSRIFRVPLVVHTHGLQYPLGVKVPFALKARLSVIRHTAVHVIASSELEREVLAQNGISCPVDVIYNGLELEKIQASRVPEYKAGKTVIGTVSSFQPSKGLDIFCRVARVLLQERGDLRFVSIGDPTEYSRAFYDKMRELYSEELNSGRLLFLPFQKDVYDHMGAFDIFFFPSRFEGCPLVTIEACVLAKPVVTFNRDGRREQLIHGVTGILCDTEDQMMENLRQLIKDPKLRKRIGDQARQQALIRFSIQRYVEEIEKIINSCCFGNHQDHQGAIS